MRFSCFLLAAIAMGAASCASKRTVLSGPKQVGLEQDDYDPQDSEKQMAKMRHATAMGMQGQLEQQGGRAFMERFGKLETEGPNGVDPKTGLKDYNRNSYEGKMFNGELKESSLKSYNQTKDFVTKNYGGGKDYRTKDYGGQDASAREAGKMRKEGSAVEDGDLFVDRTSAVKTPDARETGREFATSENRQATGEYRTENYLPAERAAEQDRYNVQDAPAHVQSSVSSMVKGKSKKNPATIEEINALVGKER